MVGSDQPQDTAGGIFAPQEAERLRRLAELTISVGANVRPGQLVVISGLVEHALLARQIARAAYRTGARLVEPR